MFTISLIEENEWKSLLNEFSGKFSDVYFTPEYSQLYQFGTKEGGVKCLKFENDEGIAIYPCLERDIPLVLTDGKHMKDIITLYGYGGPILTNFSSEFVKSFNKAVDNFLGIWGIFPNSLSSIPL